MVSAQNAVVNITAEDVRSAALGAWDVLSKALYLVGRTSEIMSMAVPRRVSVEYMGSRGRQAVGVRLGTPTRWWDENRQVADIVLEVLRLPNVASADRDRFQRAVEYLYLAGVGSSPATAFVHNWFALETLTRVSGRSIEDIRAYVPPLLCGRYIKDLLSCFLADCQACGVSLDAALRGESQSERIKQLLRALIDAKARRELLELCGVHQLLSIRLKSLSSTLLTGKAVHDLLSAHRTRLERHLQRMYRIRNSIVHAAQGNEHLVPCLKHLNTYVHRALSDIGRGLLAGMKSVTDVLAFAFHNHFATLEAPAYLVEPGREAWAD